MKKRYLALALILSLSVGVCLAGCDLGGGPVDNVGEGKHVLDADDKMGEGILDDGGEIHPTEPVQIAVGVKTEGEHRIYYGKPEDADKVELHNSALGRWNGDRFYRINGPAYPDSTHPEITKEEVENTYTIVTLDISGFADVSEVGLRVNLINVRACTLIAVSTDKVHWTDIGYPDESFNGIRGDFTTHLDELYSWQTDEDIVDGVKSDANIYACYYKLGEYAEKGKPLYVKCGWSDKYWDGLAGKGQPCDLIAYMSYYEKLEVVYDYI